MAQNPLILALLGLLVGFLMGLTSCTGAIIVPFLVLVFGFSQPQAQGTALALTLSPLQVPGLLSFHRHGNVDWYFMRCMAPGVIVGCVFGAMLAQSISPFLLKSIFGLLLVYVGSYMLMQLTTPNVGKAVVMSVIVTACAGALVAISRWHESTLVAAATPAVS